MATYVNPTGSVVTSSTSLNVFTNFTSPLQLVWPLQLYPSTNIVCTTMEFATTVVGSSVYLPQANQAGVGNSFIMINKGLEDINIQDFNGNDDLFVLEDGTARIVYLVDNTTEQGVWHNVVLGATMSPTDASALAGYGLIALPVSMPSTLNTEFTVSNVTSSVVLDQTSRASLFLFKNSGLTITLPSLASNIPNGFFSIIYNGSDNLNTLLCPTGITINNSDNDFILLPSQSCFLIFDGISNYTPVGFETVEVEQTTLVRINISGLDYIDLSDQQLEKNILVFFGALTEACVIYVGTATNNTWTFKNETTGDFPLIPTLGSNIAPGASTVPIGFGTAVQIYTDADNTSISTISPVYPLPESPGTPYLPFNSGSLTSSSYPIYGGQLLDNINFFNDDDPRSLSTVLDTIVVSGGVSCNLPETEKYCTITGQISVSPSTTNADDATVFYLERSVDNLNWTRTVTSQGSNVLAYLIGSTSNVSSLLNIPFAAFDLSFPLTQKQTIYYRIVGRVIPQIGNATNGRINANISNTVTGVSSIIITLFP